MAIKVFWEIKLNREWPSGVVPVHTRAGKLVALFPYGVGQQAVALSEARDCVANHNTQVHKAIAKQKRTKNEKNSSNVVRADYFPIFTD